MYTMIASVKTRMSHILCFFSVPWIWDEAIFSGGVPATKSVLFVYFRCYLTFSSSEYIYFCLRFPISKTALLVTDTSFHRKGSSIIGFPSPVPSFAGEWSHTVWKDYASHLISVTYEKNNQFSILHGKSGGILEGLCFKSWQGKK